MKNNMAAVSTVEGRYAQALFDLAQEEKVVEKVSKELKELQDILVSSVDFGKLIRSPIFKAKEQIQALQKIAKKMNFSKITINFVSLLARRRRLTLLQTIIDNFFTIRDDVSGRFNVYVTSARELKAKEVDKLTEVLKKKLGEGVNLIQNVDEKILGGLVLTYKSHMIDSSIKNRLNSLKRRMREVV